VTVRVEPFDVLEKWLNMIIKVIENISVVRVQLEDINVEVHRRCAVHDVPTTK